MNNASNKLEERTLNFSQSIITLCKKIPETAITKPLIVQLLRSATSVGANYAEANNAASRNDFRNKIFISKKEASETKYWLKILESSIIESEKYCLTGIKVFFRFTVNTRAPRNKNFSPCIGIRRFL